MNLVELQKITAKGETDKVEFKRTTGELKDALKTLCAFLNVQGGIVLIGVNRKGVIEGQQVSEQTIHELTASLSKFEPHALIHLERIKVQGDREVIALTVDAHQEGIPFVFDGRPYERSGNTTRQMVHGRYEKLLLERAHAKHRWENMPAVGIKPKDLGGPGRNTAHP